MNDETQTLHRNLSRHPEDFQRDAQTPFFTAKRCQLIACLFFTGMVLLGAIPGEAQALSNAFGDKLLHFCAYALLTYVLFGGLTGTLSGRACQALLMIALLGGIDEVIQSFMPYRNASLIDWMVDIMAAGLTLAILIFLSNYMRRMYQLENPQLANHQVPNHRAVRPAERSS